MYNQDTPGYARAIKIPAMSFYQKYELVRLLEKGEADRFQALDRATQQPVLLHLVSASSSADLADCLRSHKDSPKMLDLGEFAGFVYAVTAPADPFPGVREYFGLHEGATTASAQAPVREAPAVESHFPASPRTEGATSPRAEGEFTRLFKLPAPSAEPSGSLLEDGPLKSVSKEQPGEFTQMFLRPQASAPEPSLNEPLNRLPNQQPANQPIGDLSTLNLSSPNLLPLNQSTGKLPLGDLPLGNPLMDPQPQPAPQEGEFTRLFKSPLGGSRLSDAGGPDAGLLKDMFEPPKPAAPFSMQEPVAEQGDFTRIFGPGTLSKSSAAPTSPPPSPPSAAEQPTPATEASSFTRQFFAERPKQEDPPLSDDFEKFFGPGLKSGSIDMEKASPVEALPPESRPFKPAGEFTRMFGKDEVAKAADAAQPRTGDLSGIFALPDFTKPKPGAAPPPPDPGTATTRREETMGEYTRIVNMRNLVPLPEAEHAPVAADAPPDEAAAKRKKQMIVGFVIGFAIVVIAGIVVYLLLR